jgi:hypothetical protein
MPAPTQCTSVPRRSQKTTESDASPASTWPDAFHPKATTDIAPLSRRRATPDPVATRTGALQATLDGTRQWSLKTRVFN